MFEEIKKTNKKTQDKLSWLFLDPDTLLKLSVCLPNSLKSSTGLEAIFLMCSSGIQGLFTSDLGRYTTHQKCKCLLWLLTLYVYLNISFPESGCPWCVGFYLPEFPSQLTNTAISWDFWKLTFGDWQVLKSYSLISTVFDSLTTSMLHRNVSFLIDKN